MMKYEQIKSSNIFLAHEYMIGAFDRVIVKQLPKVVMVLSGKRQGCSTVELNLVQVLKGYILYIYIYAYFTCVSVGI